MGGINYYRKCLPDESKRLCPINSLLRKEVRFVVTTKMEKLVREILTELVTPPVIIIPNWDSVYLMRACELRTPFSPIPGVDLGGLVLRTESTALSGLVPHTESAVLVDLACRRHCFRFGFAVPTEGSKDPADALAAATTVTQPTLLSRSSTQETDSAATTGPAVLASASLGTPAPPSTTPPSDRISTWTHRRTSTATGNTPPVGFYIFGPGGAPRPSARRFNTPPRVAWPRPTLFTAASPAPTAYLVPTVLIPSNLDRTKLIGTPLTRLPSNPGDPPTAPTKSYAFGDVDELQFTDSVWGVLRDDWEQEQQPEPTCHAAMRYITIGRPPALPPDVLLRYSSHRRPSLSEIYELANIGRLHTTDDIVLLVRNPTAMPMRDSPNSVGRPSCLLNDKPIRIYVPLLTQPWILPGCHSTASCHLGTARTLRMLECITGGLK